MLLLAILLCAPLAQAQSPELPGEQPALAGQTGLPGTLAGEALTPQQDEFLRVDQALQQDFLFGADGISVIFQIAEGYYLYREQLAVYHLDDQGKQALLLPLPTGEVVWDDYFEKETEVYRHQLEVPLALPEGPVTVEVHYQGCADAGLCYPPQVRTFALDPATGIATALTPKRNTAGALDATASRNAPDLVLPLAILFSFIGGLILNLMPCVFPVLSIKALGLAQSATKPATRHLHGWAYTAGCVATFTAIAAVMLLLRRGGDAVGWGFQLQSPVLVGALAYLFFAMGLSLSGLTNLGSRLAGTGSRLGGKEGLPGSFFTGVLATVVASPCTAPFMGSALGYAVTQPAPVALAVFAALGLGMAAPFLLLSYSPKLGEKLPKPGPWMETLKNAFAFPMYLTAVWLVWVLGRQAGSDAIALLLAGAVALAFALWAWPQQGWRPLRGGLAIAALVGAIAILPQLKSGNGDKSSYWETYSPTKLEQARSSGKPVLINMTAAWCITCLANERVVLSSEAVSQQIEQLGVIALKGDWTNEDPQITELLAQYGRTSVPLYLVYPADGGRAKVLPQILTIAGVNEALASAAN